MSYVAGTRMPYGALPASVARWVERSLGSAVVASEDVVGGMSPGPVARVRTARGTTAFVKACGVEVNPKTPDLLRTESRLLASAPAHPSLPRLLDVYDDGHWVALLLEVVDGSMPQLPWRADDLARASALIDAAHETLAGTDTSWIPLANESSPILLERWQGLVDDRTGLDEWWLDRIDQLIPHAERVATLIAGTTLLHWDVRADNMLLGSARSVLVDWGQVRVGAPWMDHALLALDCSMSGSEVGTAEFVWSDPVLAERDPSDILAIAAAVAMSFLERSRSGATTIPALIDMSRCWADNFRPYLDEALATVAA